ncbi:MAG: hypothetical protein ACAI43_10645, partial [Phycisphaerae bacterium]
MARRRRQWARRFGRWALNAATIGSLVLCLAAGALWVRSYWQSDEVVRWHLWPEPGGYGQSRTALRSERGHIAWAWERVRRRIEYSSTLFRVFRADPQLATPLWKYQTSRDGGGGG